MRPKKKSPVWPYLGILACLFVLSITAPRAWDRMSRQGGLSNVLSSRKPRPVEIDVEVKTVEPAPQYELVESTELTQREEIIEPTPAVEPAPAAPAAPQVVPPAPEVSQEVNADLELAKRPEKPAETPSMDPPVADEAPEPESEPAVTSYGWPLPTELLEQLGALREVDPSAAWAGQAIDLIQELCRPVDQMERPASKILAELRELNELASKANKDPAMESKVARTRYALTRWLDTWEAVIALDDLPASAWEEKDQSQNLALCLADVDALTRKGNAAKAWREYLQLSGLRELAKDPQSKSEEERRAIARNVLYRLSKQRLSSAQQKFVDQGPLVTLQAELRAWASEPISSARLLADLERFERTNLPSDAESVAKDWRGLAFSAPDEAAKISQQLETHYRNANLRVAASVKLFNRMVPQPKAVESEVNDTVVNVPVFGVSTTFTKLNVRLVPDPRRIRVGLEATGLVVSDTVSSSGPATFYNEGQSTFLVRKLMVLGPRGLNVWPAIAEAENSYSSLIALETDFDGVPLVGSLVRNIARSQHDDARFEAKMEVEQKVAIRAQTKLDDEIRPRLVKAAEAIEKKQVATLNRLGLELVPLALETTEERAVGRLLLATPNQLGAHTPRPRAPSDSWFSMQLHQSALNNGLEQLKLDGREFTLPELFAWISEKLDRPEPTDLDDLPEDIHLRFADQDAVRVRCEGGRVEVTFAFAELTQGRNRWRDFTVRTHYRPEANERDANFVRDSTISLEGKSLKGRPQVVLRTIFSKVLSRNRDLSLLDPKFTHDPRLSDLAVSQFMVEDGWIGLAYSPQRGAKVARKPK